MEGNYKADGVTTPAAPRGPCLEEGFHGMAWSALRRGHRGHIGVRALQGAEAQPWCQNGSWADPAQRLCSLQLGCWAMLTSSPQHPGCGLAAASLNWRAWDPGFRRAPPGAVRRKPLRQVHVEPEGQGCCVHLS